MLHDYGIEPWVVCRYTSNELQALSQDMDARAKAASEGGDG